MPYLDRPAVAATVTSDDRLLGLARLFSSPVRHRISLRTGRIAVATC